MKLLSATEGEGLTVVPADFRTAEVRLQFYHEKLVLYSGDNEILGHWGALPHIAVSSTAVVGLRGGYMSYAYKVNEDVLYRAQGTQGRAVADPPMIYTIVQCIPIEADGRLRYRIKSKSGNVERVVTEDKLLYAQ